MELSAGVERLQDPVTGEWEEIDLSPQATGDGFEPELALAETSLPEQADEPNTVEVPGGEVAVEFVGADPVDGVVFGDAVVYPEALDGRDLVQELLPQGIKESVVLDSAAQGGSYEIDLSLPEGTTAVEVPEGVAFVDAQGATVGGYGDGIAFDSDLTSTDGSHLSAVLVSIVSQVPGGARVRVSVSSSWLNDPGRVFPVTIDPYTWTITGADSGSSNYTYGDQYVRTGQGTASQFWGNGSLRVGVTGSPAKDYHSELRFDVSALAGVGQVRVEDAHVDLWNNASGSCVMSDDTKTQLLAIDTWEASTLTWTNQSNLKPQPLISSTNFARGSGCMSAGWVSLDATSLVQFWANDGTNNTTQWTNAGFALWPAKNNEPAAYRQFSSMNASNNKPKLIITYEVLDVSYGPARSWSREVGYPQEFDVWVHYDTPDGFIVADTWNGNGNKQLSVRWWAGTTPSAEQLIDIPVSCGGGNMQVGDWCLFTFSLANPPDYPGSFGLTFDWKDYSPIPPPGEEWKSYASSYGSPMRTDVLQMLPVAHFGIDPYAAHAQSVNTFSGSYTLQATDLSIPGPGPALELVRTYNSGDHVQFDYKNNGSNDWGPFGEGWHFNYETRVITNSNGATLVLPDGRWETFKDTGNGTFSSPPGSAGTLSWFFTYKYVDARKMIYWFDNTGRLFEIEDKNGYKLKFTYDAGTKVLTKVERWLRDAGGEYATGRYLTFAWNPANTRIEQVSTNPVTTGVSLTWNYQYAVGSDRLLDKVCDPRYTETQCTGGTGDTNYDYQQSTFWGNNWQLVEI